MNQSNQIIFLREKSSLSTLSLAWWSKRPRHCRTSSNTRTRSPLRNQRFGSAPDLLMAMAAETGNESVLFHRFYVEENSSNFISFEHVHARNWNIRLKKYDDELVLRCAKTSFELYGFFLSRIPIMNSKAVLGWQTSPPWVPERSAESFQNFQPEHHGYRQEEKQQQRGRKQSNKKRRTDNHQYVNTRKQNKHKFRIISNQYHQQSGHFKKSQLPSFRAPVVPVCHTQSRYQQFASQPWLGHFSEGLSSRKSSWFKGGSCKSNGLSFWITGMWS